MADLVKIKEVSSRYDISARTLRYYEDMGLINSLRSDDYAYRMYDDSAINRLKQILILRKLNVSIKDIQRIFNSPGSEVVLEVLGKKATDIDDEVVLLHELKEIVLEFIQEIRKVDFQKDSDVKLLYEKAKEIEQQLANINYNGNPSNVNRLIEVTEKLEKLPDVRIIEIPQFRAVSSGYDTFDNVMNGYGKWRCEHSELLKNLTFYPSDFMWFEKDKCIWIDAIEDWVTEADTNSYEIIEFEGGLYAVAVMIDGDSNSNVYYGAKKWVENSDGFELDERLGHRTMAHTIGTEKTKQGLGFAQQDIFIPIKLRPK